MDKSNTLQRGQVAEQLASAYLKNQGLRLLTCNYRSRGGEIDLIMQDGKEIVFVEVRSRKSQLYGSAVETIDPTKQRKIIRTALYYLAQHNLIDKVNCRFDVIGISYPQTEACIEWICDAFSADDF